MPGVLSVGLGGGSAIRTDDVGKVTVGPDSVGHFLTSKALVFGGDAITSTDVVVAAAEKEKIGQTKAVSRIAPKIIDGARQIKRILQRAIEDMKVSAAPVTVLLVGGDQSYAWMSLKA
jgi:N-methylhydantoinase A/oxoprolinase/acetone carboxylase beta subunit